MFALTNGRVITIDLKASVAVQAANVLGRFGKTAFQSTRGIVHFGDIFGCLGALRIASSGYIGDEIVSLQVTNLNRSGLVMLFSRIIASEVESISSSLSENESMLILSIMLRNVNEQFSESPP